jgi:hypothetical protein
VLGRFLSADTKVPDPGDPKAFHRYAFNLDNPVRYVDPTGHGFLDFLKEVWVSVLITVLVIAAIVVITIATGGTASFLWAVAIGALIGGAVGAVVGAIAAVNAGFDWWSHEFWLSVGAGFILGAFVGAAVGAMIGLFSVVGFAAAATADKMAALVLISAASGSAFGGYYAYKVNGGFTDDFAMDFMLWGTASAALTAALLAAAPVAGLPPLASAAGRFLVTAAALIVANWGVGYSYYQARLAQQPAGATTGALAFAPGAAASSGSAMAPLPSTLGGLPGWLFRGTILDQSRGGDATAAQAPFDTMPLVP